MASPLPRSIVVASHRRSGTHLAIDLLLNNLTELVGSPGPARLNLDRALAGDVCSRHRLRTAVARAKIRPGVYKTHAIGNLARYFRPGGQRGLRAAGLMARSVVVYVYRDGRDVLESLHRYHGSFDKRAARTPILDYLREDNTFDSHAHQPGLSRVQFWAMHVQSWTERKQVIHTSFETMLTEPSVFVRRVADAAGLRVACPLVDVRWLGRNRIGAAFAKAVNESPRLLGWLGVRSSSVRFHTGIGGRWQNTWPEEAKALFEEQAGAVNRMLGHRG